MNNKNIEIFKQRLNDEKTSLKNELAGVAKQNPSNPNNWEASTGEMEVDAADENEVADKFAELEENTGIVSQLENQLNEVVAALERIDKGTYGICEVCGKPIEDERLEANPSARISIKHNHGK